MNTITNTIKSNTIKCKKISSFNGAIDFNLLTGQLETNKEAVEIKEEK